MKTKITFLLFIISTSLYGFQFSDRIAVVADGNHKDSDDICGTPVTLAMLKIFDKANKLVHYSHSCDLSKSEEGRETHMHESLFGTASKWGGFDTATFFNAMGEQKATVAHLKDQINASSENNILWIIEAGEPDIIYYAVKEAKESKRQYVRIVTHHPHNDIGKDFDLADIESIKGISPKMVVRISDQNKNLKKRLSDFYWMRDHSDSRVNWLWERGVVAEEIGPSYIKGTYDCSDAGMIWYVLTGGMNGGDTYCTSEKFKGKLEAWLKKR